ncbi:MULTISPECIES: PPC domain-containing DNA-binding protein [Rhodobacterales]|nr:MULTISPECIES: DUF296 domain-containing protein [Rhodobacterales]
MAHPGRFNPIRIQSEHSDTAGHFRVVLQPGKSLHDALVHPLRQVGVTSASTTVLGGVFSYLEYCVAPPDPRKEAVIRYSDPIIAGASYLVFGNATLGRSSEDNPMVHCHAAVRREDGVVMGGHIIPEKTIVGTDPISVLVTSFEGFELRQMYDPETNIPLFQPVASI